MKRRLTCLAVLLLALRPAAADEGMWLIDRLEMIWPQMRAEGLKLRPGEIYNESAAALADAVVAVDGGAGTGSMISREGLMITNHHVAYSDICALSTPERNILEEGFWASTRGDEIPVPGKSVSFLRKVEDVTTVVDSLRERMKAEGRWGPMAMRRLYADIEKAYGAGTDSEVSCVSLLGGRQYIMCYYDVYRDVRLVGVPPVRIGAFGGDFDNWGWPQHKGDFALYRVYADSEGRPADRSAANVPLRPRTVLPIATGGLREGDFTMVIGFPGRTDRYASSYAIGEKQRVKNPIVVRNRHERMDILRRRMERDPRVRMAYSDAFFGLSNYADFAKWETRCLARFGVEALRRDEETRMQRWIESDSTRNALYGTLLSELERGYAARREAERALNYFREAWLGPSEALLTANRVASFLGKLDRLHCDSLCVADRDAQGVVAGSRRLRRNYDPETDRDLFIRMATNFTDSVPREMWGEPLRRMYDAAAGDAVRMAREAFDASFCSTAERYDAFFAQDRSVAEIRRDPLVALAESVRVQTFTHGVERAEKHARTDLRRREADYATLLYDFRAAQDIPQYPNANSTMRLSYGTVQPLSPSDGVHYDARSTVAGYVDKYDPERYEYRVDARMRELIAAKAWGRWGEKGTLYVNFLSNNDITGGNSGSPVLDGRGRLVGLAFDGNRESMAGDVWFHPSLARTVSVDIRFVMWVIGQYAGAEWLLEEMTFVR